VAARLRRVSWNANLAATTTVTAGSAMASWRSGPDEEPRQEDEQRGQTQEDPERRPRPAWFAGDQHGPKGGARDADPREPADPFAEQSGGRGDQRRLQTDDQRRQRHADLGDAFELNQERHAIQRTAAHDDRRTEQDTRRGPERERQGARRSPGAASPYAPHRPR